MARKTAGEVAAKLQANTVRRLAELVARLHEDVEQGAETINLSALYGDDDVWTIRQEVSELYDKSVAALR